MAGLTITTAANILKTVYLPPVRELLDNSTVLLKYIEKEIQDVEGTNFTVPLHTQRNESAGIGVAENATLFAAGVQGYASAIVPSKYLYSRIQVSGPTIAATKSNKGSFLRALDSEMKGVAKDTRRAFNRQLNSDGRDPLAFWVSGATTALVVDDGLGNVGGYDFLNTGAMRAEFVAGTNSSNPNTVVAGKGSTGGTATTATRGALVATGRNVTFSATVAVNQAAARTGTVVRDGDYIIQEGSLGKQMTGIDAVISNVDPLLLSGGLHGLTVASNPDWVAQVVHGGGGTTEPLAASRVDLSFPLMQQVFSAIATNSDYSEADIKLLLCSYQMRDTYVKLCQDERVFYNTMKLDGGFDAVSYNGKPLVPDVHTRHNAIFFIVPDSMAIFRLADIDWMDKDGSIFYRISGGDVDAYGATLFVYQELGCKSRNANGRLDGVAENF